MLFSALTDGLWVTTVMGGRSTFFLTVTPSTTSVFCRFAGPTAETRSPSFRTTTGIFCAKRFAAPRVAPLLVACEHTHREGCRVRWTGEEMVVRVTIFRDEIAISKKEGKKIISRSSASREKQQQQPLYRTPSPHIRGAKAETVCSGVPPMMPGTSMRHDRAMVWLTEVDVMITGRSATVAKKSEHRS